MIKSVFVSLALLLASSTAFAQSEARGFGLGVETNLSADSAPLGAIAFAYDMNIVRIDGLFALGFVDERAGFTVGARFHYVLHHTERSDFSIGMAAIVGHRSTAIARTGTRASIEAVSQIRFFVVENVAATGSLGMGVGFGDGEVSLGIGGQLTGAFGLMYFF